MQIYRINAFVLRLLKRCEKENGTMPIDLLGTPFKNNCYFAIMNFKFTV